jgi:hypothetical protein
VSASSSRQADEGDALADGRVAGDDEVALDIGGLGVDVLELRGVLFGVVERRALGPEEDPEDHTAVLDRRQFGLQRAEQQHVRPRDQRKGQHHQPAPRQRGGEHAAIPRGHPVQEVFHPT